MNINSLRICKLDTIQRIKNDNGFRRILVIKPSSLGDILHSYPAFYLLRKSLPEARIDWVINSSFAMLLSYIRKDLSKIINFRRNEFKDKTHAPKALLELIRTLRTTRYDLVVDMQGLMRSSMMTFVTKATHKAGFADVKEKMSGIFYNIKVSVPDTITHAIEKNCHLVAKVLGIETVVPDFSLPKIGSFDIRERLEKFGIARTDKYIAISPTARWKTKTWPPEFFAKIIDAVSVEYPDKKFIILGSKAEREPSGKVKDFCRSLNVINLSGETGINELVEVIRNSDIFLTNDSGPMHIAAFMRVPVFAIFGPTIPEKTGPYWPWHKVYQSKEGCVRCLKRTCQRNDLQCQSSINYKQIVIDILTKLDEMK